MDKNQSTSSSQPAWWTNNETSGWDRAKEALRRDWEQTKHDFSKKSGAELNQDVTDTVKQAAGKEHIPAGNQANPKVASNSEKWGDEAAVRYGYGAGTSTTYKAHKAWDNDLEGKLQNDWNGLRQERPWSEVRDAARFGWDRSRVSTKS